MSSSRCISLFCFCLLSLYFARAVFADITTPDDRYWLAHQVAAPGTRFFSGTIQGKSNVFLRLAPKAGEPTKLVGSYYLFSPDATIIEVIWLDGVLKDRKLALKTSDWDAEYPANSERPVFALSGYSAGNSSRLRGAWFQKGKKRYVELRERKFELPGASSLIVRKVEKDFPSSNYYVAMHFPQLNGAGADKAKFNRKIELLSYSAINRIKEASKDFVAPGQNEDPGVSRKAYAIGSVEFSFAANSIISGDLLQSVYYGGAHHSPFYSPFTYDLKRGRDLKLEELFTSKNDYLKSLASLCRGALRRSLSPSDDYETGWLSRGSAPKSENYGLWNLTPNGLLITFDTYQVASGASGQSQVLIPYGLIKHILKPEFSQRLTNS